MPGYVGVDGRTEEYRDFPKFLRCSVTAQRDTLTCIIVDLFDGNTGALSAQRVELVSAGGFDYAGRGYPLKA